MLLGPIQVSPDGLRADVRVDAPVRAVFDHISDLHTMESWWPEHPVYRRLRGDGGAGSLYAWVYVVQRFPIPGLSRVLVRAPDTRFEYRAGPPGVGIRIGYRFTPEADGTRIGFSFLSPFARAPSFAAHLVPEVSRALDRLAAHLARSRNGAGAGSGGAGGRD